MNLKTIVKVANLVHDALVLHRSQEPRSQARQSAVLCFQEIVELCRKIEKCTGRFPLARAGYEKELALSLSGCRSNLESLARQFRNRRRLPSLRDIVSELQSLTTETQDWTFDREEQCLSVQTEPIELEGILLGPFSIRLDLNKLPFVESKAVYKVIALEPNPPTCNETVTHPHVRDDILCEGDAASSINAALLDGRLCDFFLLVQSVLRTYNAGSPYVKLENWEGVPCYDCGCVVDGDYRFLCQGCENDFCNDCVSACSQCGFTACRSCLGVCDICEQEFCDGCRKTCHKCRKSFCSSCVQDGVCDRCKEKADEEAQVEETLV